MAVAKRATTEELQRLYRAFSQLDDADDIRALMEDMCTIREVNEMAQRLNVAFMLDDGISYNAIQEKTGSSATTIARVSKALNFGAGGYRNVIDNE
ncbi:MAG: TrpR-like protein YerC/YecD [Coriobacteriales bacterium]|jgi:TrpR-related protein YerC/YecD|nr:TrpR-like protein YerC/YecD [Coriobacteriales bacterium]